MIKVSVVVSYRNGDEHVFETIASVRAQSCRAIELILVNDGTDQPESLRVLERASRLADRYIEQKNCGLAAARNIGFQAAREEFVVPLDAGDLIRPEYVRNCLQALEHSPSAAFAYTGIEVFGGRKYMHSGTEYNLYLLLDSNHITCTALVRKADWQRVGGYDESMLHGCEDWEFWLRLGSHGGYGTLVPKRLFLRRQPSASPHYLRPWPLSDIAQYIRRRHPELYDYEARTRIKAEWQPAVCIFGPHQVQTIEDVQAVQGEIAPDRCNAGAFLLAGPGTAAPHAAEMAALAVWGGQVALRFPDGSRVFSHMASRDVWLAEGKTPPFAGQPGAHPFKRAATFGWLNQHLINAELNSLNAWLRHPFRSALRLVPLRIKERINEGIGRPLFDLSFYLQFQPSSVLAGNSVIRPLRYMPSAATRRRIAFITPHLGPGGAERVLLDIAAALDPEVFELFLLATHSRDNRWASRWSSAVEHVYDLAALVPSNRISAAIHSIVTNWQCKTVMVQNSLFGYAALPMIRQDVAHARILDLVHAAGGDWDQIAATSTVSGAIDIRVAVSDDVRRRFLRAGVPQAQIRLIKNGVDLQRFRPHPPPQNGGMGRVLFAGRLDAVKRPRLLIDIAESLVALRAARDFRMVVAGDGPELPALKADAQRRRVEDLFEFHGLVDDIAPLLAQSDVLILPSREEGIPLVILEAMASARPVVASMVGAISEAVDSACAVLVQTGEGEASRFGSALQRLLNEHQLRAAMGAAGRKKAEAEFNLTLVKTAYRQLFE